LAHDTGACTESLRKYGEWAQNEISFLQRFVTSGSTVLDVGAYIGTHTLAFARFVGPTGRVIAVEAQPSTFVALKKNVDANVADGASVVQLENAIASSELAQIAIPTMDIAHPGSFGSTSLLTSLTAPPPSAVVNGGSAHEQDHARVRVITVDSLQLQSCALIKVDVEGVEDMVLRGAVETLERCSPVVYCECNALAAGMKTATVLERAGYKVFAHVVDAFNADNFFHVEKNIFGDSREVALVGVPGGREAELRSFPPRPCELLLDIRDADDLALALLNKPQYQVEVLRQSYAAQTGGVQFLDGYEASRLELDHLKNDNANLQRIRADEQEVFERRVQAVYEEKSALAKQMDDRISQLSALLTQRDSEIAQRHTDIAHLRALVAQNDADIAFLRTKVAKKEGEISDLRAEISDFRNVISDFHAVLAQRDESIAQLNAQISTQISEVARINTLISTLCASKSWKLTAPLRWASEQIQRRR
jgi:FkbM family methyltransferase